MGKYTYEYPRPALTADAIILSTDVEGHRTLLLIRRGGEPFKGSWALPGGFVNEGEQSVDAARRELEEETGLEYSGGLTFVGMYDKMGRDPRGWTVGVAYMATVEGEPCAKGGDDAAEARWFRTDSLPPLAFDHSEIIADALDIDQLQSKLRH